MKKTFLILAMLAAASVAGTAQDKPDFKADFEDAALRFELSLVGDAKSEFVTLDRIVREPVWPETRTHLIEPFENGRTHVRVIDVATNRVLYTRGFDTMFGEYRTTAPALAGEKKAFRRSVRIPCPRRPALVVVEARDKLNLLSPLFVRKIDPADYHIVREGAAGGAEIYEALKNGPPATSVDLVFVAEGYTAADKDKFKADVDRAAGWLFEVEPYKSAKAKFNVTGVFRPSAEAGMDEPRQNSFKKTLLEASFNAFDLDRYMLIEEGQRLREVAAEVPYDAVVVLVNSKRYGGGGIYNDYCVTTVDSPASRGVLVHEFGHSFAGLADEYYASEVSYNDFYPKGVEPLEPNITALLDPANVKWRDLLSPGIAVPTEYGKARIEAIMADGRKAREASAAEIEAARKAGAGEAALEKLKARSQKARQELEAKIAAVRKEHSGVYDKVGVFEGAGYASQGLYRPQVYCLMISSPKNEFCAVCRQAVARMIDYFSE